MSEMTIAVLRMPPECWSGDKLDVMQRHDRYLAAADEIERLQTTVDRLPKTADGVPITPGMQVYIPSGLWCAVMMHGQPYCTKHGHSKASFGTAYSTREAAEAAKGETMSDDYHAGLTEIAAKLIIGNLRQDAGIASFVLRCRDEIERLQTIVDRLQAIKAAAELMPRVTRFGGTCGTVAKYEISNGTIWQLDAALKAVEEPKEQRCHVTEEMIDELRFTEFDRGCCKGKPYEQWCDECNRKLNKARRRHIRPGLGEHGEL